VHRGGGSSDQSYAPSASGVQRLTFGVRRWLHFSRPPPGLHQPQDLDDSPLQRTSPLDRHHADRNDNIVLGDAVEIAAIDRSLKIGFLTTDGTKDTKNGKGGVAREAARIWKCSRDGYGAGAFESSTKNPGPALGFSMA